MAGDHPTSTITPEVEPARPGTGHDARRADPFGWIGATLDGSIVVEAVAGEGGFGIVYRGRHVEQGVSVAIKCLKVPAGLCPAEQDQFLARLQAEAKLLHRLSRQTAGIVQALYVGAEVAPSGAWAPYLVMEWLEGETLEQHLAARRRESAGPPGIAAAAAMLAPAAQVLVAVHEENVAHLDLKPANLFLDRSGAGTRLKVLDFGVARTFAENPRFTVSTSGVPRAFTPRYGAPEQFSVQYGAPGPWTDVFAMALLLIEVASGQPALEGNTVMQLFVATMDEGNRKRLLERIPGANDDVRAVLRRALDVSPRLRYPNMGALWAALEKALAADSANQTQPIAGEDVSMTVPGRKSTGLPVKCAAEESGIERPRAENSWRLGRRVAAVARPLAIASLVVAVLISTALQTDTQPIDPAPRAAPTSAPVPPAAWPAAQPAPEPVPDPAGFAATAASATPPSAPPVSVLARDAESLQGSAPPRGSGAQTHTTKGTVPKRGPQKRAPTGITPPTTTNADQYGIPISADQHRPPIRLLPFGID